MVDKSVKALKLIKDKHKELFKIPYEFSTFLKDKYSRTYELRFYKLISAKKTIREYLFDMDELDLFYKHTYKLNEVEWKALF